MLYSFTLFINVNKIQLLFCYMGSLSHEQSVSVFLNASSTRRVNHAEVSEYFSLDLFLIFFFPGKYNSCGWGTLSEFLFGKGAQFCNRKASTGEEEREVGTGLLVVICLSKTDTMHQ